MRARTRTGRGSRIACRSRATTSRTGCRAGPYDLVVSNPPYVEPGDLGTLQPEVRDWEPEQALVGHGVTEQIARGARDVLRANGALVLEVADGTAPQVTELLSELGYHDVAATPDLAERDRVVEGRWTP